MDKIVIKQKAGTEDKPLAGINAEVFLNGKKLTSATSVKFALDAKGVATCSIEMVGNIEVSGNIEEGSLDIKEGKE